MLGSLCCGVTSRGQASMLILRRTHPRARLSAFAQATRLKHTTCCFIQPQPDKMQCVARVAQRSAVSRPRQASRQAVKVQAVKPTEQKVRTIASC